MTIHTDLVPHILIQLRTTTIPVFQQLVLTRQREYMENKLKFNPSSLATLADQECQVLKHANQWLEMIDLSVAAMQFKQIKTRPWLQISLKLPKSNKTSTKISISTAMKASAKIVLIQTIILTGFSHPHKTCLKPDISMDGPGTFVLSVDEMADG
jgi:hypothetical protein